MRTRGRCEVLGQARSAESCAYTHRAQYCDNSPDSSMELFILMLHYDGPVTLCILLKAVHNHASIPWLLSFKQLAKMAIVVDKYDCSHSSPVFNPACSTDCEEHSISVGEPCSRFNEPCVGVQ